MSLVITSQGIMNDSPLTARERDVLLLLANGLQQKQIAEKLFISTETAKRHLKNAYKKLGAHNRVEALRKSGMW